MYRLLSIICVCLYLQDTTWKKQPAEKERVLIVLISRTSVAAEITNPCMTRSESFHPLAIRIVVQIGQEKCGIGTAPSDVNIICRCRRINRNLGHLRRHLVL